MVTARTKRDWTLTCGTGAGLSQFFWALGFLPWGRSRQRIPYSWRPPPLLLSIVVDGIHDCQRTQPTMSIVAHNLVDDLAAAAALPLSIGLREDVDRYVRSHLPGADPEQAPFPRRLDLWAYGLFADLGLKPENGGKATYKFKDTASVNMSPELCELLAAVAAAGLGPEDERVTEPSEIVRYANRLAAVGCPIVVAELKKADLRLTPLEKMVRHAESLLERVHPGEAPTNGGDQGAQGALLS